jgi:hypothetical protein
MSDGHEKILTIGDLKKIISYGSEGFGCVKVVYTKFHKEISHE